MKKHTTETVTPLAALSLDELELALGGRRRKVRAKFTRIGPIQ